MTDTETTPTPIADISMAYLRSRSAIQHRKAFVPWQYECKRQAKYLSQGYRDPRGTFRQSSAEQQEDRECNEVLLALKQALPGI